MSILISKLRAFAQDESGATAIEYALIGAVVSVGGIVAFDLLGGNVTGVVDHASGKIGGGEPPPNSPPDPPPESPPPTEPDCPPLDPCTE